MSESSGPCPVCSGDHVPLDSGECWLPWLAQLEASGLHPAVEPDLSAADNPTLERWHVWLVCGVWPEDFPVPVPEGFYRHLVGGSRPDRAWHVWSESCGAVCAAEFAIRERSGTWRDRPALL